MFGVRAAMNQAIMVIISLCNQSNAREVGLLNGRPLALPDTPKDETEPLLTLALPFFLPHGKPRVAAPSCGVFCN
ncbi:hypothetical protein E2C01_022913 [Portunus trituberculatus]|uniref:Uncharacterized protein n=1 Tax=Portunus trituberculatus TaxID=210409 RepID=A0A5B7E7F3_PORTR|nr:hypothetical protein [Portunus trituberculatus]